MTRRNYIISYTAKDKDGGFMKEGKFRVKNKLSEFDAKCSFEEYLKRKYPTFGSLTIHSCKLDLFGTLFKDDPFNQFGL